MTVNLKPAKKLGFGLMRLPTLEDGSIDLAQVCSMADAFLEKGFTYFDTAYPYHNGNSERAVKKVLTERHPREAYTLATKLPIWALSEQTSPEDIFKEQLERTGADYFDYYLLHAISKERLETLEQYDCWNFGLKMKEQGKIRHFGFSFHDTADVLDQILTAHPEVEFVQLQINYLDWDDNNVQSGKCYEVACKHNVPVVVMEPVKGGTLAQLPERAAKVLNEGNPNVSTASWALRFCGSLENVMMVLSGMSDTNQMIDNIHTMDNMIPLGENEKAVIKETVTAFRSVPTIPCTACAYCVEGCPMDIQIPDIIKAINHRRLYENNNKSKEMYQKATQNHGLPSSCVSCGQCEGVCPQHLEIIKVMQEAANTF